jgi:hypothetical protein
MCRESIKSAGVLFVCLTTVIAAHTPLLCQFQLCMEGRHTPSSIEQTFAGGTWHAESLCQRCPTPGGVGQHWAQAVPERSQCLAGPWDL